MKRKQTKVIVFPQLEERNPMEKKSVLKSKTVWANMAVIAVGVLGYLQGHELIVENPTVVAILGVAIGVGNVILRLVTDKPVK